MSPRRARPHHAFPYSAALPTDPFRPSSPSHGESAGEFSLSNLAVAAESQFDASLPAALTGSYLDSTDRPFSADAATHAYWTQQRALLDAEAGEAVDPRFSSGTAQCWMDGSRK